MPPFVAFAGVLGGLAVVRWAYKTAVRINQELEEMRLSRVAEAAHAGDIQTLRRDPGSGSSRRGCPPQASCPGLSRASPFLRIAGKAWMAGTSPAMMRSSPPCNPPL